MKHQAKVRLTMIALACASFSGVLSNAQAQAQAPEFPKPILACEFKDDCHSCIVILKKSFLENDDDRSKKTLIVRCDGDTVYDGKALVESTSIDHNHRFAVSVISGTKYDHKPEFPSVSVDGDVEDHSSFVDHHARLRLNKHDVLLGKCIHFGKHHEDNDGDDDGDTVEPSAPATTNPTP